jgi:hypothetical protein
MDVLAPGIGVSAAEQAGSADTYGIAAAADLPFENCSFDLVVA